LATERWAVSIVPDTKDWTWVLDRACPECGYDSAAVARQEIAPAIVDNAAQWRSVLADSDHHLRFRPRADRWSPLEYACHVRDVFRLYDQRLHLMLDEDNPTFANWDQDETAVTERYREQDPATVEAELVAAAGTLAASFAAVSDARWERRGHRSDGADFSVESFARYMIHDPIHHLYDVRHPPSGTR
jgi:DinB superfamily